MMFGRPPAAQKDWADMYFYEKLHHLVDHCTDFIVSKVNWWLPSVAVGMALSIFVIGGPEAPAQGLSMAIPVFTPVVQTPMFSASSGHQQAPPEEEF